MPTEGNSSTSNDAQVVWGVHNTFNRPFHNSKRHIGIVTPETW